MTFLTALILSVVEGLTEFLPISSTGHLILANKLLELAESSFTKSFDIIIQLGAILAVTYIYRRRLLDLKPWLGKIMVAFIPTGIIGLTVYKFVKEFLLGNYILVAITLFLGGVIIILFERWYTNRPDTLTTFAEITYRQAFIIGCAQALAIIPGVSRSAATIIAALGLGIKRDSALEFSFLLAIPTMAAATGLDLIKSGHTFTSPEWQVLALGFCGAFISAWIAIRWLVRYVSTHNFKPFGWYRIIVSAIFLAALFIF